MHRLYRYRNKRQTNPLRHGQPMQAPVDFDQLPFTTNGDPELILATTGIEAARRHVIVKAEIHAQVGKDSMLRIQQDALLVRRPGLPGIQSRFQLLETLSLAQIIPMVVEIADETVPRAETQIAALQVPFAIPDKSR